MNPFVPGIIAGLVFALSLLLVKDYRIQRKEDEKRDAIERAPAEQLQEQNRVRIIARQEEAAKVALRAEHEAERQLARKREHDKAA